MQEGLGNRAFGWTLLSGSMSAPWERSTHVGVSLRESLPCAHEAPSRGAASRLGMSLGPGMRAADVLRIA